MVVNKTHKMYADFTQKRWHVDVFFSIILASFFFYGTKDPGQVSRVAEHNAGYFPARDSVLPVFTQLIAMQHWCANCHKLCASDTHLREFSRCLNRILAVARHCIARPQLLWNLEITLVGTVLSQPLRCLHLFTAYPQLWCSICVQSCCN